MLTLLLTPSIFEENTLCSFAAQVQDQRPTPPLTTTGLQGKDIPKINNIKHASYVHVCTARIQDVYRTCTGRVQDVYRTCTGRIQDVYRTCTGRVQDVYRMCRTCVQDMYSMCTGRIQRVQDVYRTHTTCTGCVQDVYNMQKYRFSLFDFTGNTLTGRLCLELSVLLL